MRILPEGTIVGFNEGKVGLNTNGSKILGVVSARPVVVGSYDHSSNRAGAVVAYCGRLPVRVIGCVSTLDMQAEPLA